MATLVQYADLRPDIVAALRSLGETDAENEVIRIGAAGCEVDWNPSARYHHSQILPLALLTAAIDEGAARARWQNVGFAEAVGECVLDQRQKAVLLHLGAYHGSTPPNFGDELHKWIDRFGLAKGLMDIGEAASHEPGYRHHIVRPAIYAADPMPALALLKRSAPAVRVAAIAVMALHNRRTTMETLKAARMKALNVPVVDGFAAIRDMGADAHRHLLRMIAAYAGW